MNDLGTAYFDVLPHRMKGDESYPILGDLIANKTAKEIIERYESLYLTADCERKAIIAHDVLRDMNFEISYGSLAIVSGDRLSTYGFNWNPPLEGHFWLQRNQEIIDLSLPGVIIRGTTTRDEIGPFLVKRKPVIIAGDPPEWCLYQPYGTKEK